MKKLVCITALFALACALYHFDIVGGDVFAVSSLAAVGAVGIVGLASFAKNSN